MRPRVAHFLDERTKDMPDGDVRLLDALRVGGRHVQQEINLRAKERRLSRRSARRGSRRDGGRLRRHAAHWGCCRW